MMTCTTPQGKSGGEALRQLRSPHRELKPTGDPADVVGPVIGGEFASSCDGCARLTPGPAADLGS